MSSTWPLPERSSKAFALPGERAAALLIHGFTGCPVEVRGVGDALSEAGIEARGPLLPGHGEDPLALNRTSRREWLEAMWTAFRELDPGRPRFLVGSSMGGSLAIQIAAALGDQLTGLVLLAPALVLQPTGQLGALLARRGLSRVVEAVPKEDPGGDCADPEGRAANAGYAVMPTAGIAEFDRVRRDALLVLPHVRCPVAVLHGAHDRTIHPSASERVAKTVRSPWVERTVLPRSRHLLGLDYDREWVCQETVRFCERVLAQSALAGERAEIAA